jgi:hypothetical protein
MSTKNQSFNFARPRPPQNAAKLGTILISPPPLPRVLIQKIILPLQSPLIFAVFCRFLRQNAKKTRVSRQCEWTFSDRSLPIAQYTYVRGCCPVVGRRRRRRRAGGIDDEQ